MPMGMDKPKDIDVAGVRSPVLQAGPTDQREAVVFVHDRGDLMDRRLDARDIRTSRDRRNFILPVPEPFQ